MKNENYLPQDDLKPQTVAGILLVMAIVMGLVTSFVNHERDKQNAIAKPEIEIVNYGQ